MSLWISWYCTILGASNGKGFTMGVRAWLKLARHLFVKPKDGRLSSKDMSTKIEETRKANNHDEVSTIKPHYNRSKSNGNQPITNLKT